MDRLSLTMDEVMHIRNVLTKAELESLLVKPDLHEQVAKGKVSERRAVAVLVNNTIKYRRRFHNCIIHVSLCCASLCVARCVSRV